MNLGLAGTGEFSVVYDLRDDAAWRRAHRHRALWGKLYTDFHVLDDDHVVLVFRPAGQRWAAWEAVRRELILKNAD